MYTPKKILLLLMVLLVSVSLVGCDTTKDEGTSDAELFLGNWLIVEARDQDGVRDQTAVLAALGALSIELTQDGMYTLAFKYTDPQTPDAVISEAYTVNDSSSRLLLVIQIPNLPPQNLPVDYSFNSDTEVELTIDGTLLAILLNQGSAVNIALEGGVVLVGQKQ